MAYTTVNKSSLHFNTKLYTGTGSTNAITGVGFQPDWVWIKRREIKDHNLVDAVRGVQNAIASNTTDAQGTYSNNLSAFGTDGFTLGTGTLVNASGGTYASWNWKANGQGSSNTDGTINSTYTSANSTSGFSIVKYTGTGSNATVGHGLGVIPKMIMVKNLSTNRDWAVYHKFLNPDGTGSQYYMHLNNADPRSSASTFWQNADPNSTVFSIGTSNGVNTSGDNYIAYCYADTQGFSKFGAYTGNGNSNGVFNYTGFKPAFLMIKCSDTTGEHWHIHDTKRQTYNVDNRYLLANTSDAESTSSSYAIDILSNGFKTRTDNASTNGSSKTYLYMAFAEAPLVGSNNVPATAR